MSSIPARGRLFRRRPPALRSTLLDLVVAVNDLTDSAEETIQIVQRLVGSGRVHLTGAFRGLGLEDESSVAAVRCPPRDPEGAG